MVPWDHQLYLPPHDDGVVRDLGRASQAGNLYGPSAFCLWLERCPAGAEMALPLRPLGQAGSLPAVSAAHVVGGDLSLDVAVARGRSVLIGLTQRGKALIDRAVEDHVATQHRLVAGMDGSELDQLDALLRKFLATFENPGRPAKGGTA